jgi:hypothetical protein
MKLKQLLESTQTAFFFDVDGTIINDYKGNAEIQKKYPTNPFRFTRYSASKDLQYLQDIGRKMPIWRQFVKIANAHPNDTYIITLGHSRMGTYQWLQSWNIPVQPYNIITVFDRQYPMGDMDMVKWKSTTIGKIMGHKGYRAFYFYDDNNDILAGACEVAKKYGVDCHPISV